MGKISKFKEGDVCVVIGNAEKQSEVLHFIDIGSVVLVDFIDIEDEFVPVVCEPVGHPNPIGSQYVNEEHLVKVGEL